MIGHYLIQHDPATGWSAGPRVWTRIYALSLTLLLVLGIASPLLSNLRADELYFLSCAYSATEFATSIYECHVPATFAWIFSGYVRAFGFVGSVIAYKLTVALLMVALLHWLLRGLWPVKYLAISIGAPLVLAAFLFYVAGTRGIEIRMEFLGITFLLLGVSPLIGREQALRRRVGPVSIGFVLAQLALSAAAILSLRLTLPAAFLGMALITANSRVNEAKLFSSYTLCTLAFSVTLIFLSLSVIHILFLDIYDQFHRITNWSPPPHHHSPWQRTFLDIGLVEQIRHSGWNSQVWRIQRLVIGLALASTLLIFTWRQRAIQKAAEHALMAVSLLVFWLMLAAEAKPFAYVVALEAALCLILWCACFNLLSCSAKGSIAFVAISFVMGLLVVVQANVSNSHVRDMTIVEFSHGMLDQSEDRISKAPTTELLGMFRHRHFFKQLIARREFCQRFEDYVVLARYSFHPVCLKDIGSQNLWLRSLSIKDARDLAEYFPRVIVMGYPQIINQQGVDFRGVGHGVYIKD